jgi:hypothetical protein
MSAIKDNSVLCSGIKRKIKLMVLMRKGIRLKQGESTMLRKYLGTVDVNCELDKTESRPGRTEGLLRVG